MTAKLSRLPICNKTNDWHAITNVARVINWREKMGEAAWHQRNVQQGGLQE
jgi:hypothetical protein